MPRFERLQPDAAPPADAVVVTLWRATGRTVADVVCTSDCLAGDLSIAEFPRPVPLALERAEEMRRLCNLSRVVVALDDPSLWRQQWGELVDGDQTEVIVQRSNTSQLRIFG